MTAALSQLPVRFLEVLADAGETEAQEELARRYAAVAGEWKTAQHRARLAAAWLAGFTGHRDPYALGRGGNFTAPLSSAHAAGARKTRELTALNIGAADRRQARRKLAELAL